MREFTPREPFAITNPNTGWVVEEIDRLYAEWAAWQQHADGLTAGSDSPDYDHRTCTVALKDGRSNLRRHEVLREKTLVYLGNNFSGYAFLFEQWKPYPHEDNTERLAGRVPAWLQRLDTLRATISYARVPEGFWVEKGKQLVDKVTKVGPEKAADIASSWLKNPFSNS